MKLLIVDGNNIAHRARYKFQLDNAGTDVSVTYGFLHILLSYLRNHAIDSCIVCWDGGAPLYRRERVPEYKQNRSRGEDDPLAYEDLIRQMRELHIILPLMGVLSVKRRYIEADDLMAHAAQLAHVNYDEVIIASSDKDMLQCLRMENVRILNHKNEVIGAEWVQEEYGISVDDIIHWRAIQGDSSDNIAGVHGVGPKTATKLVAEYGDISTIVNASGKLGKIGDKIAEFGLKRLIDNFYVMVLAFDRSGARKTLLDAAFLWESANISKFEMWLLSQAFISLQDPSTYKLAKHLQKPELLQDVRTPVVYGTRNAI